MEEFSIPSKDEIDRTLLSDIFEPMTQRRTQEIDEEFVSFVENKTMVFTTTLRRVFDKAGIIDLDSFMDYFAATKEVITGRLGGVLLSDNLVAKTVIRLAFLQTYLAKNPYSARQLTFSDRQWEIYTAESFDPFAIQWGPPIASARRNYRAFVRMMTDTNSPDQSRPVTDPVIVSTPGMDDVPTVTPTNIGTTQTAERPSFSSVESPDDASSALASVISDVSQRSLRARNASFRQRAAQQKMTSLMTSLRNTSATSHNSTVPHVSSRKTYADFTWDGKWESFPALRKKIEAAAIKANIGHLIDQRVIRKYSKNLQDLDTLTSFPNYAHIGREQFSYDLQHFYGVLKGIFCDHGDDIVDSYMHSMDGMMTWWALLQKYEMGGNKDVAIETYESVIAEKYHSAYPGGLTGFFDQYHRAFAKLQHYDRDGTHQYNQARRMRITLRNLRNRIDNWQYQHLKSSFPEDFDAARTYITDFELQAKSDTLNRARAMSDRRRTLHTNTEHVDHDDVPLDISDDDLFAESRLINAVLDARGLSDQYRIPDEIYRLLDRDTRINIAKAKKKALERVLNHPLDQAPPVPANVVTPNTGPSGLPRQYGGRQANLATTEDAHDPDPDPGNIADTVSRLFHVSTEPDDVSEEDHEDERTCRAHTHYYHATANLITSEVTAIAVSDSGADSCVIGRNWDVCSQAPASRKATLIGFDKGLGSKRGLPIVDAVTKVFDSSNRPILLGVREAVLNAESDTTLLSEFQVRHSGLILDSVARNHRLTIHGQYGTQALHVDRKNDSHRVPLVLRNSLMTIVLHPPTPADLDGPSALPVFWITSPNQWRPHHHHDDAGLNLPFHDRRLMHIATPSAVLGGGGCDMTDGGAPKPTQDDDDRKIPPTVTFHGWDGRSRQHKGTSFEGHSYSVRVNQQKDEDKGFYYFDPRDDNGMQIGEPTNVGFDPDGLMTAVPETNPTTRDEFLTSHDETDLVDFAFAVRTTETLRNSQLETLRPYLGFRPLDVIKHTLANTTQLAKAIASYPMKRHFHSRFPFLRRFRLVETVSTDPMFANTASQDGYTAIQVFYGVKSHMINVYGMKGKGEFVDAYQDFMREEGVPSVLMRDNAREETGKAVIELNRKFGVKDRYSEPHYQHQNHVEGRAIRWLKPTIQALMDRTGAFDYLWYHAARYLTEIHNRTADESLSWLTPFQLRKGFQPDISAYLGYQFFERVYYLDNEHDFPKSVEKPGWWIGVAENYGDALTYFVLTEHSKEVIVRSVLRSADDTRIKNLRAVFGDAINSNDETSSIGVASAMEHHLGTPDSHTTLNFDRHPWKPGQIRNFTRKQHLKNRQRRTQKLQEGDDSAVLGGVVPDVSVGNIDDDDTIADDAMDQGSLIGLQPEPTLACDGPIKEEEAELPNVEIPEIPIRRSNRIKARKPTTRNALMAILGGAQQATNPLCFSTANMHNESIQPPTNTEIMDDYTNIGTLSTKEAERMVQLQATDRMLEETEESSEWDIIGIKDHRVATRPRKRKDGMTVLERHLRVLAVFRDGESHWVQADSVRLDDPFPIVAYAVQRNLVNHKWFAWVGPLIQDAEAIGEIREAHMAKRATRYKFGVEVPYSVKHALLLDSTNGNHLWQNAIKEELKSINEHNTFRMITDETALPKGYQRIPYHFVFDVKFDGRRKARLVAGGNMTEPPHKEDVYSGVVGVENIRIAFTLAALNNLTCCAGDISTAFLYGKTAEKVFVIAGPEFGQEICGKRMVIEKGLYGLTTSSARFHEHLSSQLRQLGFLPSKADADLWYREQEDHMEYLATYVDDLMVFSRDPMSIIKKLQDVYVIKGVGVPEYYLGGNVEFLDNGYWAQQGISMALSAGTYIENTVAKLEKIVGKEFPKYTTPMMENYHPELDDSPFLDETRASQYRALIGSANWVVTLGRFDVAYATNTMARYSIRPREEQFHHLQRIFGYLKNKAFSKGRILIDPKLHQPLVQTTEDHRDFNWSEFYPEAVEDVPKDLPASKGASARLTIYVDADFAHDHVTRRSVTGILVFLNNTPIRWFSKMQRTVETSTYSSELVAARIATEMAMEYRFALRALGVRFDGPTLMLGDNNAVVLNTTLPSSQLKKKHQAVAYHRIREAIAAKIVKFVHIPSSANFADVLTKPVSSNVFHSLVKPLLFRNVYRDGSIGGSAGAKK